MAVRLCCLAASVTGASSLAGSSESFDAVAYYRQFAEGTKFTKKVPFAPQKIATPTEETFTDFVSKGVPVVVTNGLTGTPFDPALKGDAGWGCEAIGKRFPTARMRVYSNDEPDAVNDIEMSKVEEWSKLEKPTGVPEEFVYLDVVFDRSGGQKLGLVMDPKADMVNLHVKGIKDGAVSTWNSANPDKKVEVGDLIIEVNGVSGRAAKMLDACKENKALQVKVRRMAILGPKLAPLFWEAKTAEGGEHVAQFFKDLEALPKFFHATDRNRETILNSPEFWFSKPGAGTLAHMDHRCEATVVVQLAGTKRFRLAWPTQIPSNALAPEGTFRYGAAYKVVCETAGECHNKWNPSHVVDLGPGEMLLIPPAFMRESLNVGDTCASSLTFQLGSPHAAEYFRMFHPRLRRMRDFKQCFTPMRNLATFDSTLGDVETWMNRIGLSHSVEPEKNQHAGRVNAHTKGVIKTAATEAWTLLSEKLDKNEDGYVDQSDVGDSHDMKESIRFFDLNADTKVADEEFIEVISKWLFHEAMVREQKKEAVNTLADPVLTAGGMIEEMRKVKHLSRMEL